MNCEICNWAANIQTWTRPLAGGRRHAHFYCCIECKETGLQALAADGQVETQAVLGWDVFIPIWSVDDE